MSRPSAERMFALRFRMADTAGKELRVRNLPPQARLDVRGQTAYNNNLFEGRLIYALFAKASEKKDSKAQTQEEDACEPSQEERPLNIPALILEFLWKVKRK